MLFKYEVEDCKHELPMLQIIFTYLTMSSLCRLSVKYKNNNSTRATIWYHMFYSYN